MDIETFFKGRNILDLYDKDDSEFILNDYHFNGGGKKGDEEEGNKNMELLAKLNGGIADIVRNRSTSAPLANPKLSIPLQREQVEMRRDVQRRQLREGTYNAYSRMEKERALRRSLSYRPMPRIGSIPKNNIGFDIPERVGTAGEPNTDEPVVSTAFRDTSRIIGRGMLGNEGGKAKPFFF